MSNFEATLGQLPKPILDKLLSMIRRVRRLLFIRGFFATLSVALVCLLGIMAVDAAITLFSTTARWALSLAGLVATLVAAWWFLIRPLSRRFTLTHMARIIEIRHPELQERISTAVELLASDDPESIRGSQELIDAVVESAVVDVATVDPKTEFKPVRSKKFMLAAAGFAAVISLLLAIWPTQSWTLLARAVAPFLDLGNAYAETLSINPGDVRVAKGNPVTIQVSVKHKRITRAEIRRLLPDGGESVERMNLLGEDADGTRRFSITFPSVEEDFDYRVRAGAALSRYFGVVTVDPPKVETLALRYDYPAYTGMPPVESESATGEIRAVDRTRVTLTATLNKTAWTSQLFINETTEIADPVIEGNLATWSFDLTPALRGHWHIELTDEEGFANQPSSHPLEVLPDKAPTVQITRPVEREIRLKPTERLPLDVAVIEDFGFGDLTLLVTPDNTFNPMEVAQPAPLATDRPGTFRATPVLDLPSLKLSPNQNRLAVQVRVRDNRPADYDGPGAGLSDVLFVVLDENAKSLADQAIEAQRREIDQQIKDAKKELERARDEMRRTEQELNRSEEMTDKARERLNAFTELNYSARKKLEEVATTLNTPLFQQQSAAARQIAEETLAEAQDRADMIPVTDEKQDRLADALASREKVEDAMRGLDDLAKAMREAESDYRAISKLNELANRQQELAMRAENRAEQARSDAAELERQDANEEARKQLDQQQRREMDQFRSEQNRVEQQLGEMLKENAAALAEVLQQQRNEADTLAQQAQALAERQESLREASERATERKDDPEAALREALLEQLESMQSQLAEETKSALPSENEPPESTAPSPEDSQSSPAPAQRTAPESLAKAAKEAEQAAGDLGERKLEDAARAATEASQLLAEAAAEASPPAPPGEENPDPSETAPETAPGASEDPSAAAEAPPRSLPLPAAILSGLAVRQETVARQIEAVSQGRLQEALAMMESGVENAAKTIEAQAKGVEQTLENLKQSRAKASTDRAEKALAEGAKEAADSANQLARAQAQQSTAQEKGEVAEGQLSSQARSSMQQGQRDQQQSADALARAAEAFAQSSEAIGQTLEGLEPSESDDRLTNSEDLAESFNDVSKSTQSQSASEAASQSQQAADSLQQLAQAAMQKLGNSPQGEPGEGKGDEQPNQDMTGEPDSTDLNETGQKTADANGSGIPPELLHLGISLEDWTRFKGALIGGNATAIETDLPAEYRELVGRYFQVIAKEAGKAK